VKTNGITKPYRIGLLGASKIAPTTVLAPLRDNPDFVVTAVAARDPARARAYAAEHEIAAVAESYAALIHRDDIDVIYNGLPPAGHESWTIAALKSGKAVLCEKPFARNASAARSMVQAAADTGQLLMEAFHYRFHNVMRRAEEIVRSGDLGALRSAEAVFQVTIPKTAGELRWIKDLGGGALMDLGCYPLHALRTLIGAEPVVIGATGVFDESDSQDGVDTAIRASLQFPNGVAASIGCSMTETTPSAWLRLEGERGTMEIINFLAPQMGCRFTTTIAGETTVHPTEGSTTYAAQLSHLGAVLSGETAPLTGGADAVAQMTAIDAIYALARDASLETTR
jgi:predicted dehydrogenase